MRVALVKASEDSLRMQGGCKGLLEITRLVLASLGSVWDFVKSLELSSSIMTGNTSAALIGAIW